MLKGYKIIDADSHVYEPYKMWEDYLEPDLKALLHLRISPSKVKKFLIQYSDLLRLEGAKQVTQTYPLSWLNSFDPESHVLAMYQDGG